MNSNNNDQNTPERIDQNEEIQNDKSETNLVKRIGETIRFHQWIDRMDQKDKKLDPAKRKKKWGLILGTLFLLYLSSFVVFPKPKLIHESIPMVNEINTKKREAPSSKKSLSFEMPVDSFENALKKHIHESIPEKK